MPREITDKEAILSGLKSLELTSELFIEVNGKLKNANDLEVIVEGKVNARQARRSVCAAASLRSGETIMRQGEWGGNTFYLSVEGALDVYIGEPGGEQRRSAGCRRGTCFGEMAVLAGVERNATVIVPQARDCDGAGSDAARASSAYENCRSLARCLTKLIAHTDSDACWKT